MPRYLGQHFLKNKSLIRKIIDALEIKSGDAIVEIGLGHGELTVPLGVLAAERGANVVAIEKDEKLAASAASLASEHLEVIHGDALKILPDLTRQMSHYKLAGNLPYYLTGHLLRVISELATAPERSVFMLQKEVAERICAAPPRMNRLAASVQFWAAPKILANVPKKDFAPPPAVDSALILLATLAAPEILGAKAGSSKADAEKYYAAVRTIFAQPRKTISNNLAAANHAKGEIAKLFSALRIDPASRPQDLTIEQIKKIAEAIF